MAVDELIDRFSKIHLQIVDECLRHCGQTGYLQLQIVDDYFLIDTRFIPGQFDYEDFPAITTDSPEIPEGMEVVDAFYIYFQIVGRDHIHRLNMRKLILQLKKI